MAGDDHHEVVKEASKPASMPKISPAAISATAAIMTFVMSVGWYTALYQQNWQRDRETAAMRVCENFAFGAGKEALDRVEQLTRYIDKNGQVKNLPITKNLPERQDPAITPDLRLAKEENIRSAVITLINMLDVSATGLDAEVYYAPIVATCLQPAFAWAAIAMGDDKAVYYVPEKGHERIKYWADRLADIDQTTLHPSWIQLLWHLFV